MNSRCCFMCFANIYSFNPHINLRYRSVYEVEIATLLNYLRIIASPQKLKQIDLHSHQSVYEHILLYLLAKRWYGKTKFFCQSNNKIYFIRF